MKDKRVKKLFKYLFESDKRLFVKVAQNNVDLEKLRTAIKRLGIRTDSINNVLGNCALMDSNSMQGFIMAYNGSMVEINKRLKRLEEINHVKTEPESKSEECSKNDS